MPFPSAADFADWHRQTGKAVEWPPCPTREFTVSMAKSFLEELAQQQRALMSTMERHAVGRWLFGQGGYKAALAILNGKRRRRQLATARCAAEALLAQIDSIAEPAAEDPPRRGSRLGAGDNNLYSRITWATHDPAIAYVRGLVNAIDEYREPQRAEAVAGVLRAVEKACDEHRAAAVAYGKALQSLDAVDLPFVHEPGRFAAHVEQRAGRLPRGFDLLQAVHPLKRRSENLSERLFVFRAWVLNRRYSRGAKPEAIAYLMTLDGFRHQFDSRTIERLCASFTGNLKAAH